MLHDLADDHKSLQALELNDIEKYFHHPSPIDPLAVASTWLDDGSRLVFASISMASVINTVKQAIPADVMNGLGAGWNFFDGIGGNISAVQQFRKLPEVQRRKKEKAAWAVQDLILSELLISGTILTLLTQYGVLTGLAAAACAPLSAITFAAGTWGALAHSLVNLKREYNKLNDNEYLLKDKITKYNNIKDKIDKLEVQKNEAFTLYENKKEDIISVLSAIGLQITEGDEKAKKENADKISSLNKELQSLEKEHLEKLKDLDEKIARWQRVQTRLIMQLQALRQVKFAQGLPHDLETAFNQINIAAAKPDDYELNKNIVLQLEKNQKEKIMKHTIATIGWSFAAVGMTLVAVSPFVGPLAPVLMATGIAITAVAGAVKLVEFLGSRITNALAKKHRYRTEQDELIQKYKNYLTSEAFQNPLFQNLSMLERLKYYLSYQYSHQQNPGLSQQAWYESLNAANVTAKQRQAILDGALEKKIKEEILMHTLQLNHKNPQEKEQLLEVVKQQISDKGIDSIVNRECRASLKEYLKEGIVSLFSHKNEKVAAATVEPDEHPRDAESF